MASKILLALILREFTDDSLQVCGVFSSEEEFKKLLKQKRETLNKLQAENPEIDIWDPSLDSLEEAQLKEFEVGALDGWFNNRVGAHITGNILTGKITDITLINCPMDQETGFAWLDSVGVRANSIERAKSKLVELRNRILFHTPTRWEITFRNSTPEIYPDAISAFAAWEKYNNSQGKDLYQILPLDVKIKEYER